MGNRKPSTPTLVTNPATDMAFSTCAQSLVEHGAGSIGELELALQVVYPRAAVHARELANESVVIWYVYREGRWVSPERSPTVKEDQPNMPDREDDLRATEESIHRDAERLRTIEEEKSAWIRPTRASFASRNGPSALPPACMTRPRPSAS